MAWTFRIRFRRPKTRDGSQNTLQAARRTFLALTIALMGLGAASSLGRAQTEEELPLTGPAFGVASEAYKAFERGDYSTAAERAREAIRQRPDVARLKRLLVDALAAAGGLEEAVQAATSFIDAGVQDPDLVLQRDRLRERIARDAALKAQHHAEPLSQQSPARSAPAQESANAGYEAADAAYKAFARKDYAASIGQARKAAALEPENRAYRALLVNALSAGGRKGEAEKAASAALARHRDDGEILMQRGYVRLALGRPAAAADDFAAALRSRKPPATDPRIIRLTLADAALAAKQPQRALDALAPIAGERSYAVAARRGFALLALGRREEALAAFTQAAAHATIPRERATATSAEIGLLVDLDRRNEARTRFAEAREALSSLGNLELAYLANRVGADATAGEHFGRAYAEGTLKGLGLVDAAYVVRRLSRNDEAKDLLRAAIDAAASGSLALETQYLFGIRREMSELERSWGAYSSLSYGAVGVMPSVPFAPSLKGGHVLQAGTEIYWRPPAIGYRNGTTFDVFGRAFQTLSDETGGPTGSSTTQGSVGARWKPLGSVNLVLEAGRLFPIGRHGRADTLLRAAFSDGAGTDLRLDVPDWWTWQIYGDIGYFVEEAQTVGAFEGRLGRSFRLDGVGNRLVLTPFLAVGGGYDSLLATPEAIGAGPGLNLRYWFRESRYTAPMSSLDLNVQYRFKLTGDDRAEGIFAGISLSY